VCPVCVLIHLLKGFGICSVQSQWWLHMTRLYTINISHSQMDNFYHLKNPVPAYCPSL
jgi:hypothetical protein